MNVIFLKVIILSSKSLLEVISMLIIPKQQTTQLKCVLSIHQLQGREK